MSDDKFCPQKDRCNDKAAKICDGLSHEDCIVRKMYNEKDKVPMHWYCLTFEGDTLAEGKSATASVYASFTSRFITKPSIDSLKEEAGVKQESVLISCSYLGLMSREVFLGGE